MYFTPKNGSRIGTTRIRSSDQYEFGTHQFANEIYQVEDEDQDFRQFTEFGDARESFHEYLVSESKQVITDDCEETKETPLRKSRKSKSKLQLDYLDQEDLRLRTEVAPDKRKTSESERRKSELGKAP